MEKDLKFAATKGIFWSFIDLLLNQGVSLVIQIFLARLLLPKDFGIIGIVVAFTALAQTIVDSGFTNALIRESETSQEDYSTVFFYNIVVSFLLYVLMFVTAESISRFYEEPILVHIIRVLSISIIINCFGIIQKTILIKNLDFKSQMKINSVASIVSGSIAVFFAYFNYGVWSLVIYTLIRSVIQSILFHVYVKWYPSLCFSIKSFIKYYEFGWKLLVSTLIDTLYSNINNLIIGKIYSKVDLGYFTNASKLSNVAQSSIYGVVGKVSYPVFGKLQEDNSTLKNGFKKIIVFTSFINFPLMVGLIVTAEPIFQILLGSKWIQAIPYFQLLCISGIIYPLQAINLNILQVKGRTDLLLKITIYKKIISIFLICFVIFFKLNIFILLWIGVLDSFISYFINSHYSSILLDYSIKNQIKDIILLLFSSFLMGIVIHVLIRYLMLDDFVELGLSIFIGVPVYFLSCKLMKATVFDDFFYLLRSFFVRTNNKHQGDDK